MIARETAAAFAESGYDLILAGRDEEEVGRVAADIAIRHGVRARSERFDALDTADHGRFAEAVTGAAGDALAGVVVAFGVLGDSERAVTDFDHAQEIMAANYVGAVSILTRLVPHFERQKSGFIVGISSVSGDRGRGSIYTYGSAKGGFSLYLQGLRNRLHKSGVHVLTVKPGFIDTRMTYGAVKPGMAAEPAAVARAIIRGVRRKKSVVYVPRIWRIIMFVIRNIPEPIFKRLEL
ncbi:MAG: SDR family oxidoreductase [Gemmatimonadetes bacterium]|nr:SDR family oxidoreductase [Gemmatimonadota bacterium]NIO30540.1 SDR family oxidoreductase [Gemmatimonadota bacterium]